MNCPICLLRRLGPIAGRHAERGNFAFSKRPPLIDLQLGIPIGPIAVRTNFRTLHPVASIIRRTC